MNFFYQKIIINTYVGTYIFDVRDYITRIIAFYAHFDDTFNSHVLRYVLHSRLRSHLECFIAKYSKYKKLKGRAFHQPLLNYISQLTSWK